MTPGTCENFKTKHKSHNAIYRKEEATWTFLDVFCITSLEILAWRGQLERLIRIISTKAVNFFDSVSLEFLSNGWNGCVRSL